MSIKTVPISEVIQVQNACWVPPVQEVWCQIKFRDCETFCDYLASPDSEEPLSRELYAKFENGDYGEITEGTGEHYVFQPKTQAEIEEEVKAKRNQLLLESDYTGLPAVSATMTSAKRTEWETYRQALRDVTSQTRFPWDPLWPTKPS